MDRKIGGIRPSQIITTYGPGSIVDFKMDSALLLGLDSWPSARPDQLITEPRLQALLKKRYFRTPGGREKTGRIPSISFPRFRVCNNKDCGKLSDQFQRNANGQFVCGCKEKGSTTHPVRIIAVCPSGHIDDFPWVEWVHKEKGVCSNPDLRWITWGTAGSLSDVNIVCNTCKASQNLGGVLSESASLGRCSGNRPWLEDREACTWDIRALQRGASNVYFPSIVGSLSIPPWNNPIEEEITAFYTDHIKNMIETGGWDLLKNMMPFLFPNKTESEREIIYNGLRRRVQDSNSTTNPREEEWIHFQKDVLSMGDFEAEHETIHEDLTKWFEKVILVHRLREVRVLKGFTRIDYPDPEDAYQDVSVAPLAKQNLDWLPGVETFGEGIFLQLNSNQLARWECSPSVIERYNRLFNSYNQWRVSKGWNAQNDLLPRIVLLHTLSHAIMRQLSLYSGYSSSSIRERIYAGPGMYGLLLYTATPDSDGTLGGLVLQGRKNNLVKLIKSCIGEALLCSSDPLCAEGDFNLESKLNGAACHSCLFASETSCERSNRLLDRASLVDLVYTHQTGYFNS